MIGIALLSEAASADDLLTQIEDAWQGLADYVYNPLFIFEVLGQVFDNPLAVSITSALLVVAGFALFSRAISVFNTRNP